MDRRDAAHRDVAHVDALEPGGAERCGVVVDARDYPRPIAHVQRARLVRDVGSGEMMVEEGAERGVAILRDDAPRLVVEKAIDHHPVESGQRAERGGGALAQSRQVAGPLEPRRDHVEPGEQRAADHRRFAGGLQLDQQVVARPVHRHVEAARGPRHRRGEDGAARARRGPRDQRRDILPEQIVEAAAEPVGAQRRFEIAGAGDDPVRRRVGDEQPPVRLDRAGDVDRFAVARREVERVGGCATSHGDG